MNDNDRIIKLDIIYDKDKTTTVECSIQKLKSISYFDSFFSYKKYQNLADSDHYTLNWLNMKKDKEVIDTLFLFLCNYQKFIEGDIPISSIYYRAYDDPKKEYNSRLFMHYYYNSINNPDQYIQLLSLLDFLLIDNDNIVIFMLINLYMALYKYLPSNNNNNPVLYSLTIKNEIWTGLKNGPETDYWNTILSINNILLDFIGTDINLFDQIEFIKSLSKYYELTLDLVQLYNKNISLDFLQVSKNFIKLIDYYKVYPKYFIKPIWVPKFNNVYIHLPLTNIYREVMNSKTINKAFRLISKTNEDESIFIILNVRYINESYIVTKISFEYNVSLLNHFIENELIGNSFYPAIDVGEKDTIFYGDIYSKFYLEDKSDTRSFTIDKDILYTSDEEIRNIIQSKIHALLVDFNTKWFKQFFELLEFNGLNYNVVNFAAPGRLKNIIRIEKPELIYYDDPNDDTDLYNDRVTGDVNIGSITFTIDLANIMEYPLIQLTIGITPLLQLLNIPIEDLTILTVGI